MGPKARPIEAGTQRVIVAIEEDTREKKSRKPKDAEKKKENEKGSPMKVQRKEQEIVLEEDVQDLSDFEV